MTVVYNTQNIGFMGFGHHPEKMFRKVNKFPSSQEEGDTNRLYCASYKELFKPLNYLLLKGDTYFFETVRMHSTSLFH
jgi:hypothetical protein